MPSPALVDINALLKPVSEKNAVGKDLRADTSPTSLYTIIRDARRTARAAERNSMFDGSSPEANVNWQKILELAPKILEKHSKDIEIACWYTEALIRKAGFQGLRDGFTLIKRLIEQYWDDDLHPVPDEDGIETRVAPITGLNGEGADGVLLTPIRSTHITEDIAPGPFSFWQYKQAIDVKRILDDDARAEQAVKIGFNIEDIENVVEQSSQAFFVDLRDDVNDCLSEYREIGSILTKHCGNQDSPPSSKITAMLEDTLGAINHIAKFKFPVEASNEDEVNGATGSGQSSNISVGPIKNRDDAIRQLNSISAFFRQTEPHSPISYVIDKAVKWGDMSLTELMAELIPDQSSRSTYGSLTGVKTNED